MNTDDNASAEWTSRKSIIAEWVAMTGDPSLTAVFDDDDQTFTLLRVAAGSPGQIPEEEV